MAADAPRRDGDGRRPRGALGDERAHLRPAVPGQHGDNAAGMAHAGTAPVRTAPAGNKRRAGGPGRTRERLRKSGQPAEALRPHAADDAAGLPPDVPREIRRLNVAGGAVVAGYADGPWAAGHARRAMRGGPSNWRE